MELQVYFEKKGDKNSCFKKWVSPTLTGYVEHTSFDTYGIRDPLKVTTAYTIISGHQRYRIANDSGLLEFQLKLWMLMNGKPNTCSLQRTRSVGEKLKAIQTAFLKEYWKAGHGGNRATGQ